MCSFENGKNLIFNSADKGSLLVVWDMLDYLEKAKSNVTLILIRRLNCQRRKRLNYVRYHTEF